MSYQALHVMPIDSTNSGTEGDEYNQVQVLDMDSSNPGNHVIKLIHIVNKGPTQAKLQCSIKLQLAIA